MPNKGIVKEFPQCEKVTVSSLLLVFIKSLWMVSVSLPSICSQECLLSRYKPESCPALPCSVLPDKVCSLGGTYDCFYPGATGTYDIIDSQ